jgi:curved DNA-binding protein CbpA
MTNKRNYYRILHVQHDAPLEIIRASFRTLMQSLKMHPDLGGNIKTAQLINQAYEVLSNPTQRHSYDKSLKEQQHPMVFSAKRIGQNKPVSEWRKFLPPQF